LAEQGKTAEVKALAEETAEVFKAADLVKSRRPLYKSSGALCKSPNVQGISPILQGISSQICLRRVPK
jgi:hypothetical protein